MKHPLSTCVTVLAIAIFICAGPARADLVVAEGWDLFDTQEGTQFLGIPFEGVPLGMFDFGGSIGGKATCDTDTIVQRLAPAIVGGAGQGDTIDIEIVALQLVSAEPINLGPAWRCIT